MRGYRDEGRLEDLEEHLVCQSRMFRSACQIRMPQLVDAASRSAVDTFGFRLGSLHLLQFAVQISFDFEETRKRYKTEYLSPFAIIDKPPSSLRDRKERQRERTKMMSCLWLPNSTGKGACTRQDWP